MTEHSRRNFGIGGSDSCFSFIICLPSSPRWRMPPCRRSCSVATRRCRADATTLLTEVGLGHRLHHKPGELSGGEQQRVAMARALMQNPDLVLADEPTGNLDTHSGDGLFGLMRTLNKTRGTTFVIVTHNDKLSAQSDRIIHMQDGQIVP